MSVRQNFPAIADGAGRVLDLFAAQAMPEREMSVYEWAEERRVLGEGQGKYAGQRWKTDRAPYLKRPMEVVGLEHPARTVVIAGSAQSGKTAVAENFAGAIIDLSPRPFIVMTPTLEMRRKWASDKFDPMVEASPSLRAKVVAQRSSAKSSTASEKRFRGGKAYFIAAGSSTQLQMITAGALIADEIAELDAEAGDRGDPLDQAEQRLASYGEEAKRLYISTTGRAGSCRITKLAEAGTFEHWYVPCPHCGDFQALTFAAMDEVEGRAVLICQASGCVIEHHHKGAMVRAGVYVACYFSRDPACQDDAEPAENPANPRPPAHFPPSQLARWQARPTEGRYPSFHFNQLYSLFRSWRLIWADWKAAEGDPLKKKVFVQQVLALPYEDTGDAPEHDKLVAAAQAFGLKRGEVPTWAPMLVMAIDVQGDRLKWVVVAGGPEHRAAVIDHGDIPGRPENPATWDALRAFIVQRRYEGAHIVPLSFDRIGVDSGFETAHVYAFAAGLPNVRALDGRGDPHHPAMGTGRKRTAKLAGGARRASATLYPVGAYGLKKRVYFGLSAWLTGLEQNRLAPGALVVHREADGAFFKELTAESLDPKKTVKGMPVWRKKDFQANDYLDATVYALALLSEFGQERLTEPGWRSLTGARLKDPAAGESLPLFSTALEDWRVVTPPQDASLQDAALQDASPEPALAPAADDQAPPPNPTPGRGGSPAWLAKLAEVNRR